MTGPREHTTLRILLARNGPMQPARAVDLLRQLVAATGRADHAGPRTITAANIVLTGDDSADGAQLADASAASSGDPAADVSALTKVFYECLTGSTPEQPAPPPTQRRPGTPAGFDEVIARGMAADPEYRYGTADELLAAAERALAAAPQHTPGHRPTSRETSIVHLDERTRTIPLSPTPPVSNPVQPQWDPSPYPLPAYGPQQFPQHFGPAQVAPASFAPQRKRGYLGPVIAAVAIIGAIVAGGIAIPRLTQHSATPPAPASPGTRSYGAQPVTLPFTDVANPQKVAVDGAGNVYVLSSQPGASFGESTEHRVLKLAPGSNASTNVDLPGLDLRLATDIAVDPAGNLYVSDGKNVWELAAGTTAPIRLPFRKFSRINAIAADSGGNTYATGSLVGSRPGSVDYRVLKLAPGATRPTELPFTALHLTKSVAVDKAGNVYVGDNGAGTRGRVLKSAGGASAPTELPFGTLYEPAGLAADDLGDVFVADSFGDAVVQLPAGATGAGKLPVRVSRPSGVAVDTAGNIYIASAARRDQSGRMVEPGRVLKLAPDH